MADAVEAGQAAPSPKRTRRPTVPPPREPAEPPPAKPGHPAEPGPPAKPGQPPSRQPWYRRHKWLLIWGSVSLALLLVAVAGSGYLVLRHFNTNLEQADIRGLLGSQPVDTHPQAENIMVLGSDSRQGLGQAYGSGLVTDQSDTLMIIHIPANRQWAEVMSIPRDSWVNIPACQEGNGQASEPSQFKINEAFAVGNLDGNKTALGVACTVKTLEQDTGIYIDHFIVVNFTGFQSMVSALGGVYECNPTPINDPNSGLHLSAGTHLLTPKQALGYVRARYTLGDGSDLERIDRQQAFMSSLVSRVQDKLLNPLAIYRFLDATTKSLTIDSQLGGVTGLYNLGQSLRGIPSDKIAFFTIPNHPRGDGANVVWNEPEDGQIFASFRNDVPASSTLFGKSSPGDGDGGDGPLATPSGSPSGGPSGASSVTPTATPPATPAVPPSTTPAGTPTATPTATPSATPTGTPSATPSATPTGTPSLLSPFTPAASARPGVASLDALRSVAGTPSGTGTPSVAATPNPSGSATATGSGSSVKIPARTANQSICSG